MALLSNKNISPTYYSKIAQAESGNNPNAKNPGKGQTASGLYQFTAGTWNGMVKELGLNYTLEDRFNPEKSKTVMEAFTKKNASYLQKNLGRELNDADLYMAHFLGAGGASTFLKDLSANPNAGVNMSGEVINANKNVFYKKNGQLRTNKEVYEEMGKRINQPTNITNQAVENSHPEVPNISNGLTNFEGQYSLPTFVSNEEEPKKTKEEEVVEQKTNELNLLKDFYAGRTKIQPQQEQMIEEAPQEIPSMDVMGEFNQISNFLEQAREGGFFEGWAFETMQQGGTWNAQQASVKEEKDRKLRELLSKNRPDFSKKSIDEKIKEKNLKEVLTQKDNTRVDSIKSADNISKVARNKTNKEIAQEREHRIQESVKAQSIPMTQDNWREVLAKQTQSTGDKFRVSQEPNVFDDYLNPAVMVGDMASNLGQAPLRAEQTDSFMPYITSVGAPLAVGATAGLGTKSTGQFINNLANPLAGVKTPNISTLYKINDDEIPINFMRKLGNKNEAMSAIENAKSDLLDPETIRRAEALGVNPEVFEQASKNMSYSTNISPSSYSGENLHININPNQIGVSEQDAIMQGVMGAKAPNFTGNEISSHEIGHFLQDRMYYTTPYPKTLEGFEKKLFSKYKSFPKEHQEAILNKHKDFSTRSTAPTKIDEMLGELQIKPDLDYFGQKNTNYFTDANKQYGTNIDNMVERFPMFREYRQGMRDSGVLKNKWDEITPEMVDEYYSLKPENRLNSFMELNDKNKNLLRDISKIAPAIAPISGAAYLSTQETPTYQQGGTIEEDKKWLQNWYTNRVIPNIDIQNLYLEDKDIYKDRMTTPPPIENVENIDNNPYITGRYDSKENKIFLTPKSEKNTHLHELTHYSDSFPSAMRTVHQNVVNQNIAPKEGVSGVYKDKYEYFTDPDEVHARIQVLRKEAGIKPNQEVTPDFLNNFLKSYNGEDENINDLLNIADPPHLLEMLNYMADNTKVKNRSFAQQGGEIKTTPYGQWEFPNQITKVPSNNITMENVPRALMGIADTGEQRVMLPEEKNHIFEGATEVTEVPLTFAQLYKIKTGKELK